MKGFVLSIVLLATFVAIEGHGHSRGRGHLKKILCEGLTDPAIQSQIQACVTDAHLSGSDLQKVERLVNKFNATKCNKSDQDSSASNSSSSSEEHGKHEHHGDHRSEEHHKKHGGPRHHPSHRISGVFKVIICIEKIGVTTTTSTTTSTPMTTTTDTTAVS